MAFAQRLDVEKGEHFLALKELKRGDVTYQPSIPTVGRSHISIRHTLDNLTENTSSHVGLMLSPH